ncbi:hypothetical protein [Mesorhizobium sp.]|uniref:hypothetical protein n=1 Tax=Mesorhizobium sp. TaxID=1871066 RepID=UPI00120E6102|nr:hypothetical protein [Mesorhizobium sp.]TIT02510.1 MAG: hypothetical protein E5W87_09840 [Mesorhizobium sp.]
MPKKFAGAELAWQAGVHFIQCRNLRMGFSERGAQLSTLIPQFPADIAGPHGTPTPATAMPVAHELPDEGRGCLIPVSAPEREQSEMPNVTFFSEVPAARGPNFDDYAETKQSNWLKERSNPSLWRASSRGLPIGRAYAFGEFSKKKGTVSGIRTGFHQGSRQDEQNPFLAASGHELPRWPDDGRYGEALPLKGR